MEMGVSTAMDILSRNHARRRLLIWLFAGAGLLALLALAEWAAAPVLSQERTPAAAAERYFQALADGDATAATAMTFDPDSDLFDSTYLIDDVLGAATERISDVKVTALNDPLVGPKHKVEVSYTLAGERHQSSLHLKEVEPTWVFLRNWKIHEAFATTLAVDRDSLTQLTLGGEVIEGDATYIQLFPAVYPVALTEPDLFTADSTELVMNGVDDHDFVTINPTAELQTIVQSQVNGLVSNCAAATPTSTRAIEGCSLYLHLERGGDTPGVWKILEYPTVKLARSNRLYFASGGSAQFTPSDGGAPETTDEVEVNGTIVLEDGRVRLIPFGFQ